MSVVKGDSEKVKDKVMRERKGHHVPQDNITVPFLVPFP